MTFGSSGRLTSFFAGAVIGGLCLLAIDSDFVAGWMGQRPGTSSGEEAVNVRHLQLQAELVNRFNNYRQDRSRHNMVLLREIVAVYARVDGAECIEVLNGLGALALVSVDGDDSLSAMGVEDLHHVLKVASRLDPRMADDVIAAAFRRTIASDPKAAFDNLKELPTYMRESLANELAASWGAKNGPEAANAFLEFQGVIQWRNQFGLAMASWGKTDPTAPFKYIQGLEKPTPVRDKLLTDYLVKLTSIDANAAVQLISAQPDVPLNTRLRFQFIFGTFANSQPEAAISAIRGMKSTEARVDALRVIADHCGRSRPLLAIEAAAGLPVSVDSLTLIANGAKAFATKSDNPFSIPDLSTNAFQREAIQAGVAEGLFQSRGNEGIAGAVRHAVSSGDVGWLNAAGSIIAKNANIKPGAWKTLPEDVVAAVVSFAATNWPPDKVAALRTALNK